MTSMGAPAITWLNSIKVGLGHQMKQPMMRIHHNKRADLAKAAAEFKSLR